MGLSKYRSGRRAYPGEATNGERLLRSTPEWSMVDHRPLSDGATWSTIFNTKEGNMAAVAAWIRLPRMPIQYYHKTVLRTIGKTSGRFLKFDYNTEAVQRGKFTRMAVQLDLRKSPISTISVDVRIQLVEYEDRPIVCYNCGIYGYTGEICWSNKGKGGEEREVNPSKTETCSKTSGEEPMMMDGENQKYGP